MEHREKSDILFWIKQSLEDEQFLENKIVVAGTSGRTDEYVGDIFFATVSGVCKNGNNKTVNLVIKMGKQDKILRKQLPMLTECYRREILVYDRIIPAFNKFQAEKNIDYFDPVPKCYKTFMTEYSEVLILEDLTMHGYTLNKNIVPMNLHHVELVLSNYAKLHALSFALRDQRPEEYHELTSDYHRHNVQMLDQLHVLFKITEGKVVHDLEVEARDDLAKQFKVDIGVGIGRSLLDILEDDVKHSVITHGGCNNNNFLFRYKANDDKNPTHVVMLDWQVSIQHSPVIDLSGLLYSVSGEHNINKLPELLNFYHSTLTSYLRDLGTDVTKVYPYAALLEDWRRYSFYGFAFLITSLEMMSIGNENALGADQMEENIDRTLKNTDVEDKNRKTLVYVIDQYCNLKL